MSEMQTRTIEVTLHQDNYRKIAFLPDGRFITTQVNDQDHQIHFYFDTGFFDLSFAFQYIDATQMARAFSALTAQDILTYTTKYMSNYQISTPTHTLDQDFLV